MSELLEVLGEATAVLLWLMVVLPVVLMWVAFLMGIFRAAEAHVRAASGGREG